MRPLEYTNTTKITDGSEVNYRLAKPSASDRDDGVYIKFVREYHKLFKQININEISNKSSVKIKKILIYPTIDLLCSIFMFSALTEELVDLISEWNEYCNTTRPINKMRSILGFNQIILKSGNIIKSEPVDVFSFSNYMSNKIPFHFITRCLKERKCPLQIKNNLDLKLISIPGCSRPNDFICCSELSPEFLQYIIDSRMILQHRIYNQDNECTFILLKYIEKCTDESSYTDEEKQLLNLNFIESFKKKNYDTTTYDLLKTIDDGSVVCNTLDKYDNLVSHLFGFKKQYCVTSDNYPYSHNFVKDIFIQSLASRLNYDSFIRFRHIFDEEDIEYIQSSIQHDELLEFLVNYPLDLRFSSTKRSV